jgi:CubicO group peptidase (beta-lactamase class C family)
MMTLKAVLCFAAAASLASCAPYALKNPTTKAIDGLFAGYGTSGSPGASVAVIENSRTVFARAYGLASIENGVFAETNTNYRLASVTKQFTATAILMLIDRGKLSLDSRLTDALPGAPKYASGVTIRHLLTHTSGLVDYEDLIPDSQTVQVLDRDVLMLLSKIDSVYFAPGAKYQYSNSGYALLALVVEALSGQSFAQFLKQNIFEPLGMDHTVAFENGISTVASRAYGYSKTENGFLQADQSVTSAVLGDGGIYSSVDELAKWDQELTRSTLLSPSLRKQSFTPATLLDGTKTKYGFGWNIEPYKDRFSVFHTGSTRGFRNAILRLPDRQLTIIILTNRNEGEPIELARKIADLMFTQENDTH